MAENTKDWDLYLRGKKYNNNITPNYYDTISANRDFYTGNQWRNMGGDDELPKPVFNIIKRVITFFVASLTSVGQTIQFKPLEYNEDNLTDQMAQEKNYADVATAEVENLFEKFKMENKVRDALFNSAIDGDTAFHFYFDQSKKPYRGRFQGIEGEICMELIRGESVMFGNANNANKEEQPYIIIVGRDMVENIKEEALFYKQSDVPSEDTEYLNASADNIEIESDNDSGKATYIIVYKKDKKTGKVIMSKSVQNTYIYEKVDTGLDYYPIAWLNWEKQYNSYHGRALCTGVIPNQIFLNKMFAMVMYHLMMTAFPKAVYNSNYISDWDNRIGTAIAIDGTMMMGENIKNVAGYLEVGNMSNQIMQAIDMAYNYTKETLGINDASIGNIDPRNTTGVALQAVQRATSVPLENIKANLQECLEDVAQILLDMMGTNYGLRPVMIDGMAKNFDFSIFKNMWLNIKCDVGDASYWSEIAQVQTLDGMREAGIIDAIQYLERVPDRFIPKKHELISELQSRMQMEKEQAPPQPKQDNEAMYEQMAQFMESLPPEAQQQLQALPPDQMEQQLMAMMQG